MDEKPNPGSLKTTSHEFVLEKFFDEFITVWFRERTVRADVYYKARREIVLLKDKTTKTVEKCDDDTSTVKRLPSSSLHSQSDLQSAKRNGVSADVNLANKLISDRSKNIESRLEHELQVQNKELLQKVNHLKDKVHEIRADAHYELKEKDDQLEKLKKYLENLREQNNDLSKRLSKLSGDEMRQGNPDVAELSDRYRPTEIGKMFSDVYDNEWSDAYENISKMDEDKKVGILHGIVTRAFNFCDKKFNEQTMTVRTTLLGLEQESAEDDRPDNESQSPQVGNKTVRFTNIQDTLKNVRKELAMETAGNIAQQFTTTLDQYVRAFGIKLNEIDKTLRIYASKCVELCWLMVVCDPPMALSEDRIGNPYDTNIYKPYTRSMKDLKNPVLELAIWPALRLHLGGSLVAKGVAQPGEGKSK